MIDVTGTVTGAAEVEARFLGMADVRRFRVVVQRLGLELLRRVKEKLSGEVLGVRTGRLRRSVNEETTEEGAVVQSTVGTPVIYGRRWELGFDGVESVKAHTRTTAHGIAQIRAFTRNVHSAARPFLRPALAELRPHIDQELGAAAGGTDGRP